MRVGMTFQCATRGIEDRVRGRKSSTGTRRGGFEVEPKVPMPEHSVEKSGDTQVARLSSERCTEIRPVAGIV